jgi:hypothetical protein
VVNAEYVDAIPGCDRSGRSLDCGMQPLRGRWEGGVVAGGELLRCVSTASCEGVLRRDFSDLARVVFTPKALHIKAQGFRRGGYPGYCWIG